MIIELVNVIIVALVRPMIRLYVLPLHAAAHINNVVEERVRTKRSSGKIRIHLQGTVCNDVAHVMTSVVLFRSVLKSKGASFYEAH